MKFSRRLISARLHSLWRKAREPVFFLNKSRRLVYVNPAWEDLTGRSAESILGLSCRPRRKHESEDLAQLARCHRPPRSASQGRPSRTRARIPHVNGDLLEKSLEFWPFHEDSGILIGFWGIIHDWPLTASGLEAASSSGTGAGAGGGAVESEAAEAWRSALEAARQRARDQIGSESLIGQGPLHDRLLTQIRTAAASTFPIFIVGGPGTGKTLVARVIHSQSPRKRAPILPFDCAALPPDVMEREWFRDSGEFSFPNGSTLLLDDVLRLPRDLQLKIASALGRSDRVRVIAAAAQDPTADRELTPDLYYRLTAMTIVLPPLRQRLDELPLLASSLLDRANQDGGRVVSGFSAEATDALLGYDWPGNLKELARTIDYARNHGENNVIEIGDLPRAILGPQGAAYEPKPTPSVPLKDRLTSIERRWIEAALRKAKFNKSRAADMLGISRPKLYHRIKELGLPETETGDGETPLRAQGEPS